MDAHQRQKMALVMQLNDDFSLIKPALHITNYKR